VPHDQTKLIDRWSFMHRIGELKRWPVLRQLREGDLLGLGGAVQTEYSRNLHARITDAESVAPSICPYCAVGCAQLIYVKDGEVTHVEGDPASPVSRGRLCPKGQATRSYLQSPIREYKVKYRRPYATTWEELDLDEAMEMIADRFVQTREETWEWDNDDGHRVRRTLGIANLGGATLDNEENYLMKKLLTACGVVLVENQARI
jgi:formate dehydrogenase major subunit